MADYDSFIRRVRKIYPNEVKKNIDKIKVNKDNKPKEDKDTTDR